MGGLQAYMYFNSLATDRFWRVRYLRTDRFYPFWKKKSLKKSFKDITLNFCYIQELELLAFISKK